MHFKTKNYLKNNCNHTAKQAKSGLRAHVSLCAQKFKAIGGTKIDLCECVIFTAKVRWLSEVTCKTVTKSMN
jgi:hypothetical protein